mgnify:CR=1 FL=1
MAARASSLSVTVVEAVADAVGVAPVDLATPLNDAVDPDALDALFRNGTGRVSFDYCEFQVSVDARGTVEVSALKEA